MCQMTTRSAILPLISRFPMNTILRDCFLPSKHFSFRCDINSQTNGTCFQGYGLMNGRGSIPGRGKRFLSSLQRPDRLWGPPSLLSNGYRRLSPGIKRPRREADRSPPSSAQVKNGEAVSPLLHTSSRRGA
jgi:hypothetical protein